MKQLLPVLILSTGLLCWMACSKSTSNQSTPGSTGSLTLTLSEQSVKMGQPLLVSLPKGVSSSGVKWSVSPDSGARITTGIGQASILFYKAGQYRIWANYAAGSDSARRDSCGGTITVTDSAYNPPPPYVPAYDTVGISNDTLTLAPTLDTSFLILHAQSSHRYGCLPFYLYSITSDIHSGISLQFTNVIMNHVNTCGAPEQAVSVLDLQSGINGWPNGTYPFSVSYSGTTYTGSLTITGTDYTFTWNYT